ncbi:MAG TPA: MFS transporter [Polyangiaceae bacterium]|nr:MFS transporter [Polyangiaceae bacterium]
MSSSTAERTAEQQRPLLLALGLATFMVSLDARVVAPLLPAIAHDFQTTVSRAGYLVSGYLLPYGLFQLAYGPFADRFGKVRVSVFAMAAFSLGTALCGAFPSFSALLLLRALTGAAAAALIPLTIAYIGDTVPYAKRQAALAMLMASSGAAQALSMSVGGTIAELLSWRAIFPILGALSALVTLYLAACAKHELRAPLSLGVRRLGYRDALQSPLLPILLLVALEGCLFLGGFPYLSGLLEQRFRLGSLPIGLLLGLTGASQLLSARLLPRLLRSVSERELLLVGGGLMGLAYLLSAWAPSYLWVGLACMLIGTGFSLCHSTIQTRATEAFPGGRGTSLALFAFSLFLGSALGSVGFGALLEQVGYAATFGSAGLLLFAFTALALAALGRGRLLEAD